MKVLGPEGEKVLSPMEVELASAIRVQRERLERSMFARQSMILDSRGDVAWSEQQECGLAKWLP